VLPTCIFARRSAFILSTLNTRPSVCYRFATAVELANARLQPRLLYQANSAAGVAREVEGAAADAAHAAAHVRDGGALAAVGARPPHHRLELLHQERLVDVAVAQVVLDGLRRRRRLGLVVGRPGLW